MGKKYVVFVFCRRSPRRGNSSGRDHFPRDVMALYAKVEKRSAPSAQNGNASASSRAPAAATGGGVIVNELSK